MSELNFNIFNIVIFSGIVQGLIFSLVVFFHKKYKSQTNNYIALTVLVLSLSNLQYWFMDVGLKGFFLIFNEFRIPFDLVIVPAFFLFVNSYLQNENSKKGMRLLSIPFFISLFFTMLLFVDALFSKETSITINIVLEIFSLGINFALIVLIILKIKKYEHKNEEYDPTRVKIETKWLINILSIGGLLCLFWVAEILYVRRENNIGLSVYYPLWIGISILVYWISYVGLFHSKVNNEREFIRKSNIFKPVINIKTKKNNDKLFNEIFHWIVEGRIYLNPDLNLNEIAKKYSKSKGYLSQLISSHSELNFNDFVNKLRIEEAKKLLVDSDYCNYTIVAIGLESGFNSKSSFYTSFKKFTGKTPLEYKKCPK